MDDDEYDTFTFTVEVAVRNGASLPDAPTIQRALYQALDVDTEDAITVHFRPS